MLTKLLNSVYLTEQSFDGISVRGAVVCGSKRALVFDTLILPHRTNELLVACSGRELVVVYSHADWDHVWGTCGLPQAEIIAHKECARRFEDLEDVAKTLKDFRMKYDEELTAVKLVPPQRTFQSNLALDLGGISVDLRYCPGHTKDSILALVPERSLLLGADCIETPIPVLNEGVQHLPRWIETLSDLERDVRIHTCVPSHGQVGGREILTDNIAYLRSLSGKADFKLPYPLDDFYAAAHQENWEKTASLRR